MIYQILRNTMHRWIVNPISFCGWIIFRQYLKQNKHKYRIKIFKLCYNDGYTVLQEKKIQHQYKYCNGFI